MLAAIEKPEREQQTSPRGHRPLKPPPQFAFDDFSVDQIEKMMEGSGSPVRWLRKSPSRSYGASAPTLAAVRDPRRGAPPLQSGGPSVSTLNGLLQEKLGHRSGL